MSFLSDFYSRRLSIQVINSFIGLPKNIAHGIIIPLSSLQICESMINNNVKYRRVMLPERNSEILNAFLSWRPKALFYQPLF